MIEMPFDERLYAEMAAFFSEKMAADALLIGMGAAQTAPLPRQHGRRCCPSRGTVAFPGSCLRRESRNCLRRKVCWNPCRISSHLALLLLHRSEILGIVVSFARGLRAICAMGRILCSMGRDGSSPFPN